MVDSLHIIAARSSHPPLLIYQHIDYRSLFVCLHLRTSIANQNQSQLNIMHMWHLMKSYMHRLSDISTAMGTERLAKLSINDMRETQVKGVQQHEQYGTASISTSRQPRRSSTGRLSDLLTPSVLANVVHICVDDSYFHCKWLMHMAKLIYFEKKNMSVLENICTFLDIFDLQRNKKQLSYQMAE